MDKILKSFEYSALDHKWQARYYLKENGWDINRLLKKGQLQLTLQEEKSDPPTGIEAVMLKLALSSFSYYYLHNDNIINDSSLSAVTSLCTSSLNSMDVNSDDKQVFELSHIFNRLIDSKRKLLKCYDCGTNARAVFLKLLMVGRRQSRLKLRKGEKERFSREYVVNKSDPLMPLSDCWSKLKVNDGKDIVTIMSVSIESFGHVWVIEKRYFNGVPRYHHYQSALNSHMLIDFIESMDYGADPMKSLDIDYFFGELSDLLAYKTSWKDKHYRTFAELFAFMPVSPVTTPDTGFCWTWAEIDGRS